MTRSLYRRKNPPPRFVRSGSNSSMMLNTHGSAGRVPRHFQHFPKRNHPRRERPTPTAQWNCHPDHRLSQRVLAQTINALIGLSEQCHPKKSGMNMHVVLAHGMKEPALALSLKNVSLDRISYFIAKASALPADAEDDVIVFRKTEKAVAELIQTHFFKSHALLSSTWQASR